MHIRPIDLAIIVIYFTGMMIIGAFVARRNKSSEAYFLGNRSFGTWVIGISLLGTMISSLTFIAGPADAYKTAYLRTVPQLAVPFAALFTAYFIVPFFRRGFTSAYEYLGQRFHTSISLYAAGIFLFIQIARSGMIIYLLVILMQSMTGLSFYWCLLLAVGVTAFYTVNGGFTAVVWTDVVQTVILIVGAIASTWFIVSAIPGGMGTIFAEGLAAHKLSFWDAGGTGSTLQPTTYGLTLSEKSVTVLFFVGLLSFISGNLDQINVQRWVSTRTTRDAQKAVIVLALGAVPIWLLFKMIGTGLYVFFQHFPAEIPAEILAGNRKAEEIFPYFIIHHLPMGLAGLVIASALAAAMSTLSSCINSSAMVSINDIYKRFLVKDRDDVHYLNAGVWASIFVTVGMAVIAVLVYRFNVQTLADLFLIVSSVLGSSIAGVFFLGLFTQRANTFGVWVGLVLSTVTVVIITFGHAFFNETPIHIYYSGAIGNLIMFGAGFLASLMRPGKRVQPAISTVWNLPKV
jgi:SSS family solute:Na+ symporter